MGLITDLIGLVNILFPLIILIVAFYMYFTVEKETKKLLLAVSALFFMLASLEMSIGLFNSLIPLYLDNDSIPSWPNILFFLSYFFLLIIAEPWKILNKE